MNHAKLISLASMLAVMLAAMLAPPAGATTGATLTCGHWHIVKSPNPGQGSNILSAVAAISASDVWTAGDYGDPGFGHTLIEHWDGSKWRVVPSPSPGNTVYLNGVSASSSSDVWTVGTYSPAYSAELTLIEHWDGSHWSIVPSPNVRANPDHSSNFLFGVAAISSNDVWAVGSYYANSQSWTLIEHWDGLHWSIVPSPSAGTSNILNGVVAFSSSDVWAVGLGSGNPLIEHWNGKTWTIVASPPVNLGELQAISTIPGSATLWAVGENYPTGGVLVENWNGTQWGQVEAPKEPHASFSYFNGVAASATTNAWAVGSHSIGIEGSGTLIEHWNGARWSIVPSPNHYYSDLNAISNVPGTQQFWSVGGGGRKTLIEYYC